MASDEILISQAIAPLDNQGKKKCSSLKILNPNAIQAIKFFSSFVDHGFILHFLLSKMMINWMLLFRN